MRLSMLRVFAVLVVVVFVRLVGVVRRVADDDADALAVLPLDAATFSSLTLPNISAVVPLCGGVQADVVQRIHKAQVGEFLVAAGDRGVGGLDVQVGDVVGQDGDFVGVQLVAGICA